MGVRKRPGRPTSSSFQQVIAVRRGTAKPVPEKNPKSASSACERVMTALDLKDG